MASRSFSVILTDPQSINAGRLADALAQAKDIAFSEAAILFRRNWGLISREDDQNQAEKIASTLTACGIPAKAAPDSDLKPLPDPQPVQSLEFLPDGFRMTLASGREGEIKGKNISLFAAAAIPALFVKTKKVKEGPSQKSKALRMGVFLATGIPVPMGKNKEVQKTTRETDMLFYLDLINRASGARVRIDGQHLDYRFLGEHKTMAVIQNFKTFLMLAAPLCTSARLNKGAHGMLGNQPLTQLGYESLEDLDNEIHWLNQLP